MHFIIQIFGHFVCTEAVCIAGMEIGRPGCPNILHMHEKKLRNKEKRNKICVDEINNAQIKLSHQEGERAHISSESCTIL